MSRRIRRWPAYKVLAALAAVSVLVPAVAILASASMREFVYKELSYRLVAERAIGDAMGAEQIASRLNEFISERTYPGGGPALDTYAWNDLVRGIGWCDQVSWMLGTLLSTENIRGRLVALGGRISDSGEPVGHVMAEVYLDDDWRLFDPLFGLKFMTPDGQLATLADVSADLRLVTSQPRVRALPPEARHRLEQIYEALFTGESARAPLRGEPVMNARRPSRLRAMAQTALEMTWRLFGAWGARAWQDLYFALLPQSMPALDANQPGNRPVLHTSADDPALFLYYRARNYHLYERTDLAERAYDELIARHSASSYAEKSAYFLGRLKLRLRRDPAAAMAQFTAFLDTYPESAWTPRVHRELGVAFEELGDRDSAKHHYSVASGDLFVDAAYRSVRMSEGVELVGQ